jgi:hypothetical protein
MKLIVSFISYSFDQILRAPGPVLSKTDEIAFYLISEKAPSSGAKRTGRGSSLLFVAYLVLISRTDFQSFSC